MRVVGVARALEANTFHHGLELLLCWELTDALHEVLVRVAVARDLLTEQWNDVERVRVVNGADEGVRHVAELEAQEATARLEHTVGLSQGAVDVRDVADAERDGVDIKRVVGELQLLGIALLPVEEARGLRKHTRGALLTHLQHARVDIADRDVGALAVLVAWRKQAFGDAERNVARAAGHVKHLERTHRVQCVNERILPQAVHAATHEVIHDVVTLCHAVEDRRDHGLLVRLVHLLKAKVGRGVTAIRRGRRSARGEATGGGEAGSNNRRAASGHRA